MGKVRVVCCAVEKVKRGGMCVYKYIAIYLYISLLCININIYTYVQSRMLCLHLTNYQP